MSITMLFAALAQNLGIPAIYYGVAICIVIAAGLYFALMFKNEKRVADK